MPDVNVFVVTVYADGGEVGWFEIEAPDLKEALIRSADPKHAQVLGLGDQVDVSLLKDPVLNLRPPAGEAYANGIESGRAEERARCIQICISNRDEWNTAGWAACAEEILREIDSTKIGPPETTMCDPSAE